jgi:hypothetical protein
MYEEIKKLGWVRITKVFKGGDTIFALKITKKIIKKFEQWETLFEFIGKNFDGGHSGGYSCKAVYCKIKPKADYTLRLKAITREELVIDYKPKKEKLVICVVM